MIDPSTLPQAGALAPGLGERSGEPIRIAVADDHPLFRDGLCELLDLEEGFRVVAKAANGQEVLEVVERYRPEILLLDLMMPFLDGLATLRELRDRKCATKIIVLTASEDRDDLAQAMQLGAAGVVLKHDRTDVLIKSIRRVHAGEIWLHTSTTAAVMERSEAEAPAFDLPAGLRGARPSALTRKEMDVVRLVAQGLRNREIAARLSISEQTVKNHLRNIFEKLQVGDRLELALHAIHHLLVGPGDL